MKSVKGSVFLACAVLLAAVLSGCVLPPPKPQPPALRVTDKTHDSVSVAWTETSEVDGFYLFRSEDGTDFVKAASLEAGTASYIDTGLNSETAYSYKIEAYNGSVSAVSNTVTAITAPKEPKAPNLTVSGEMFDRLFLMWSESSTVNGFRILRSKNGADFTKIASVDSGTIFYIDTGLDSDTTYYYKVEAFNLSGSAMSNAASGTTTKDIPPDPPTDPSPSDSAVNVDLNPTLSWKCFNPNGYSMAYMVFFGTSPMLQNPEDIDYVMFTIESTSVTSPATLTGGTKYYWKVMASDNHGKITTGPVWSFTTKWVTGSRGADRK